MTIPNHDGPYASSHWRTWGAKNTGYGTQRRAGLGDLAGIVPLALTSRDRAWVLRHLPMAIRASRTMGLAFTQDSMRQLCTIALIRSLLKESARVLVIGDGFGVLGGFIRAYLPAAQIDMVDLSFALVEQEARLSRAFGAGGFRFVHAGELHRLASRTYHVAFNIASMQEMDPPEIARYFCFLRGRAKLFYCCNRERKELPDGTVTEFAAYPWQPSDEVLLDELCPWHQWFVQTRPPFVRRYDGPTRHRLVRLATV